MKTAKHNRKIASDYEKLPAIHQIAWRQVVIETLYQKDLTGETSWNTYINWLEATPYASSWNNLSPQSKTAWAYVANYICKE